MILTTNSLKVNWTRKSMAHRLWGKSTHRILIDWENILDKHSKNWQNWQKIVHGQNFGEIFFKCSRFIIWKFSLFSFGMSHFVNFYLMNRENNDEIAKKETKTNLSLIIWNLYLRTTAWFRRFGVILKTNDPNWYLWVKTDETWSNSVVWGSNY